MIALASPADDYDRPIQIPEALHDLDQNVIGSQVWSEDGVFCPLCGRKQSSIAQFNRCVAVCEVCEKPFFWGRFVNVHFVSATMPVDKLPQ